MKTSDVAPKSIVVERGAFSLALRLSVVVSVLVAGLAAQVGRVAAATIDLSGFAVTFTERFKTLDISARGPKTRWIAHTPWFGDFGKAVFDDPGPKGPFALRPEGLTLTARRAADGIWHSGLICSMDRDGAGQIGFAQRYGYFEMRAKLPDGPGVWPAFWLIGTDKTTSAVEIDVLEYFGAFTSYMHNSAHIYVRGKDTLAQDNLLHVAAGSLTTKFNDFGVWIEPDVTRFYLNRQEVWSIPTPAKFRQPFYILADLALGGGWPIDKLASPAVMTIASIRVFQIRRRLAATDDRGRGASLSRSGRGDVLWAYSGKVVTTC